MTSQTDWNIRSRAAACQSCGQAFVDQQPCHTFLSFDPDGYRRIDLCETCLQQSKPAQDVHSSWKGVYQVPPPPSQRQANKEDVETLLRRLVEEQDPAHAPMIFVLAVMLERKRILIERTINIRPDGIRQYVYEHRKTGDTFIVNDPDLQLDNIDELEEQVAAQLSQTGSDSDNDNPPDGHPGATGS